MEEEKNFEILGDTLRLAAEYCTLMQNPEVEERRDLVKELCILLARLYERFLSFSPEVSEDEEYVLENGVAYLSQHADEDLYNYVRGNMERIMAPDDTFLETFEEDMKYSETPIGVSISESLADIFQSLYNFSEESRLSEGANLREAYFACREEFNDYWSQTLTNVLRPLNALLRNDS